jgi:AraC-like DNA-binding protein
MDLRVVANVVGAGQGAFVAFMVFSQVPRRRSNAWLGAFVAICCLLCGGEAVTRSSLPLQVPDAVAWVDGLVLALGPCLYLYLRSFTGRPVALRWIAPHFVPALLASLAIWSFHLLPLETKAWAVRLDRDRPPALDPLMVAMAAHLLTYLLLSLLHLRRVSEELKNAQSNLDRISYRWIRRLIGIILALFGVWLPTVGPRQSWAQAAIALAFPLAVYALAWSALRTPDLLARAPEAPAPEPADVPEEPGEKYRKSRLPQDWSSRQEQRLADVVATRRCHLDPDLDLAGLAEQVGVSSHQLSQILNERLGVRFCDYVNGLRVMEAQNLLADPGNADLPVLEVATRAGFNSKATFNLVFKRSTGKTPSAWRSACLKERVA